MTALWLRVRIWYANRLLDLGLVRAAKAIVPNEAEFQNVIDQISAISRGYKKQATEALIALEAEAIADKLGLPLEIARNAVRGLLEKGELEVRPIGDGKFILCDRGGTAKWLHSVE